MAYGRRRAGGLDDMKEEEKAHENHPQPTCNTQLKETFRSCVSAQSGPPPDSGASRWFPSYKIAQTASAGGRTYPALTEAVNLG